MGRLRWSIGLGIALAVLLCAAMTAAAEPIELAFADGTAYARAKRREGPVTVVTRMGYPRDGTVDRLWLAGLGFDDNGPPGALAVVWSKAGLFPIWTLSLEISIDADGTARHTESISLWPAQPAAGDVYETRLSYDPATGATSVLVQNMTRDEVLFRGEFRLAAYEVTPGLYPGAGVAFAGGGGAEQFGSLLEQLTVVPHYIPVGFGSQVVSQGIGDDRVAVNRIDRRQRISMELEAIEAGRGTFRIGVVGQGATTWLVEGIRPYADAVYVPLPVDHLPVGRTDLVVEYVVDGLALAGAVHTVQVGALAADFADVGLDREGKMLTGVLHIESDGALPPVRATVRLDVSYTERDQTGSLRRVEHELVALDEVVTLDSESTWLPFRTVLPVGAEEAESGIELRLRGDVDVADIAMHIMQPNTKDIVRMPLRRSGEVDYQRAKAVDALLDRLQVVSLDDKPDVLEARRAYDALTDVQKARVTRYAALKEAENRIAELEGAEPPHKAPTNVKWVGARSSDYGISGVWPSPQDWLAVAEELTSYFPAAEPTFIWIVGRVDANVRGVRLEFEQPEGFTDAAEQHISFGPSTKPGHLSHDEYLSFFDEHGINVFLQVEPGFADVITLMDLIMDRFGHHESVIGFGVDIEWYQGITTDAGIPVDDATARAWDEHLKSIDPSYRLFLKHYSTDWFPPTYRSDIIFVYDGQGFGSVDGEVQGIFGDTNGAILAYKRFADHFYPNDVIFQTGYRPDAMWYYALDEPVIKDLGERMAAVIRQDFGIAWVDFMLKSPLTFPFLFKGDAEVGAAVNTLLLHLNDSEGNLIGQRFATGQATLSDAIYVAKMRAIVDALTEGERAHVHGTALARLAQLEPRALDIRVAHLNLHDLKEKDRATIKAIREDYERLNDAQRERVALLGRLVEAEEILGMR